MNYKIKAITDAIRRLADAIDDEYMHSQKPDEIKWYPCVERGGVVYKPSHIPPATIAFQIDELGEFINPPPNRETSPNWRKS